MPHRSTSPAPRHLGELERAVMERLWSTADAHPDGLTVRETLDLLSGEREIAYTTVMTVLDRLAKKGLATRERDGRAWRYLAADTREELTGQAMRTTLHDMHASDRRAALLHFLDDASEAEIEEFRSALEEVESRRPRLRLRRPGRRS